MVLTEILTPERTEPLRAEDIWPFRNRLTGEVDPNPDFDDYLWWQRDLEGKRHLLADLNMPRSFTPRPYQVEGAVWLKSSTTNEKQTSIFLQAAHGSEGAISTARSCKMIYDQPGLGKTLQACMAIKIPAIITCPGYLVDQWADFIEDQYPQWKVARINQQLHRAERQALLDTPHDIYIVNHEMWTARKEKFTGGAEPEPYDKKGRAIPTYSYEKWVKWRDAKRLHEELDKRISYHWPRVCTLVIDEAHHMRNRGASQSISCSNFADTCDFVYLLTATPQYKDVRDWWNQLRIMDPRKYTSYQRWETVNTYAMTPTIYKVSPHAEVALQKEISEYAMGRNYNDVGLYLPDLIEKTVKVNWHPDLRKAYDNLKKNMAIQLEDGGTQEINPASMLHTLRLFTACPEKVEAVKRIIEDIPGAQPIILFCWYRDCAELLAEEFALAPSSVRIDGSYSQPERLKRAAALDSRVKCVTMASASEGVDWSAASTVIFVEEDYTPGKMYQALSRVRRWSKEERKQPVIVYYVHMQKSVDEAVHTAVVERQLDIRKILKSALKK